MLMLNCIGYCEDKPAIFGPQKWKALNFVRILKFIEFYPFMYTMTRALPIVVANEKNRPISTMAVTRLIWKKEGNQIWAEGGGGGDELAIVEEEKGGLDE
jgi:hypothetical protein